MSTETLAGESHQTWAYERTARVWRFDVFREPHDGDTWICRRNTSIRLPYPEVYEVSADGIPYLKPEICLLFKAKAVRDKDRADFMQRCPGSLPLSGPGCIPRSNGCTDHDWILLRNELRLIMHQPADGEHPSHENLRTR
jgi:hypothetical protein